MSDRIQLTAGDSAPAFALTDQHGDTVTLADFAGKRVVVFVYPAAMTPGCTTEACDFRDSLAPLQAAGYQIVGVSPDTVEKQLKFAERDSLSYPLLSDPDREFLTAYGAYGEKNNYGKIVMGVIRSTFVIDEDGNIAHALYNVKATGHVARIRKMLNAG